MERKSSCLSFYRRPGSPATRSRGDFSVVVQLFGLHGHSLALLLRGSTRPSDGCARPASSVGEASSARRDPTLAGSSVGVTPARFHLRAATPTRLSMLPAAGPWWWSKGIVATVPAGILPSCRVHTRAEYATSWHALGSWPGPFSKTRDLWQALGTCDWRGYFLSSVAFGVGSGRAPCAFLLG